MGDKIYALLAITLKSIFLFWREQITMDCAISVIKATLHAVKILSPVIMKQLIFAFFNRFIVNWEFYFTGFSKNTKPNIYKFFSI